MLITILHCLLQCTIDRSDIHAHNVKYTTASPNSHPSHDKKRLHTGGCMFICIYMYVALTCKKNIHKYDENANYIIRYDSVIVNHS